jgi:hypothetical protein
MRYDVAISFGADARGLASDLAHALAPAYRVFLDEFEITDLWGESLLWELPQRYHASRLTVLIITKNSLHRFWPAFERDVIVSEVFELNGSGALIAVRLISNDVELPTLLEEIAVRFPSGLEIECIIDLIRERLPIGGR